MIWTDGAVVPDAAVAIAARDRTFEHGLGLFETLRTRNGWPCRLDLHHDRLQASARALGLSLAGATWPDARALAELRRAEGLTVETVVRITLSGGTDASGGARLWMRTFPLPAPSADPTGAITVAVGWPVLAADPLARHKTLNYWSRRLAHEQARALGAAEMLGVTERTSRRIWEGSRSNLFAIAGRTLLTPDLDGPLVPGTMRRRVLGWAGALGLTIEQPRGLDLRTLTPAKVDEVFLTNAVRGIMPVGRLVGSLTGQWPTPGPWTRALQAALNEDVGDRS